MQVVNVYREVLNFKFNCESPSDCLDCDVPNFNENILPSRLSNISADTTDGASFSRGKVVGGEVCKGCLSIWCQSCRDRETKALLKVHSLINRIEEVESLFPSTEKLCQSYPEWRHHEFVGKYKALCLWYNITTQLRQKIELLYHRLGHMTNSLIPWPTFPSLFKIVPIPTVSRDSGHHNGDSDDEDISCNAGVSIHSDEADNTNEERKNSKSDDISRDSSDSNIPSVRFDGVDQDDVPTPTDSTNSEDSGMTTSDSSATASSNYLALPGQPLATQNLSLKRCMSDIFVEANPYRKYIEKLLRNKGMKKVFDKVAEVIRDVMSRTICVVEQSHPELQIYSSKDNKNPVMIENIDELKRYGPWTSKFRELELPGFYASFMFLASVPLHMMKECLKLRLEQMPSRPSRLSIKQLMREYKEAVKFAVLVRQKYVRWCKSLIADLDCELKENLELRKNQAIEELDGDVKKMLEVYLEWLDQFVLMLHREPHVSGLQRNFLQEEWRFVQSTCPHVTEGDSLAATRFCNIACHMLCSVGDFLDTGLDDLTAALQESSMELEVNESIHLNSGGSDSSSMGKEPRQRNSVSEDPEDHQKKQVIQRCRALQDLLLEARERALRAAGLAKMLRKDLEVAIECSTTNNPRDLLNKLKETNHIRVLAPHSYDHLIFVPGKLKFLSNQI